MSEKISLDSSAWLSLSAMNFSIIIIACFCCAVNIIYIPFYVIHICHHKAKLKSVELYATLFT